MRRNTLLSSALVPIVFAWLLTSWAGLSGVGLGQQAPEAERPAPQRQVRGRLPAYFAAVVTPNQREEIYRIQARVQDQIDVLRQKIAELETGRNKEIDAVLSEEQLTEVNKKRAAAAERRRARRRPPAGDPAPPSAN